MAVVPQNVLEEIAKAIQGEKCVPFLGAGVSAGNANKPGLPMGSQLAKGMFEKLVQEQKDGQFIRDPENFPEVATHFQHHKKRFRLLEFLREKLPHEKLTPLPAHEALAGLPFKLIITTNYDTLMERALDNAKRAKLVVIQPRDGFKDLTIPMKLHGATETILYKLHGCLSDPEDNFVITEDDFYHLLATMRSKEETPPSRVTGLFAVSKLLFLGFGLGDVDFKVLFKLIEKLPEGSRPPGYAIQLKSSAFAKDYWKEKGIDIYDCDVQDFLEALAKAYQALPLIVQ
jgi:hypothetical protein